MSLPPLHLVAPAGLRTLACFTVLALAGCSPPDALPDRSSLPHRAGATAGDAAHAGAASTGVGLFPSGWPYPGTGAPVGGRRAAVSTTDAYASQVGLDVLRAGGNAVDAAVATSFALAVVNPEAGNIGGGGFMVVRMADGTTAALDYREKAPALARRNMYLDAEGNLTDRSVVGHLAAGVPGTVMGLWEAHQRFGTLPWADLVQPAVDLALGFEVRERQARSFEWGREALALFPQTAAVFLPGGRPPREGEVFRQPDLARTLARIRDRGTDGFYRGETAIFIVAEMIQGGGIMTHTDLEQYRAVWREPVVFDYRDHTLISMPPSSSGGATMAEMANILERHDLASEGWNESGTVHLLAEAWRRAYADRNHYLGDPDFVEMPLDRLVSEAYAANRAADISLGRATPSSQVGPGLDPVDRGSNTTHFSIVDPGGNAVAVTTTINSWFGNKVVVRNAGFLLNNEMDDFAAKPGAPNQFGLVQGEANAIEPGKRMLSAMTPTIVLDPRGELFMVTGTPGGSTIITTTFQTIMNVIDHGMNVLQAVHAPRVHHQHLPDQIYYEPGGLTPEVVAALEAMGHTLVERTEMSGDVQAILVAPDGSLTAWSDPRRGGTALAW